MARFSIREVTVREPDAAIPDSLVVPISVDAAGLDALRRSVQPAR